MQSTSARSLDTARHQKAVCIKMTVIYYLMVDFPNTEDGNKKAQRIVSAGEFGGMVEKDAISEAYLNEHEKCLLNKDAINILCKM